MPRRDSKNRNRQTNSSNSGTARRGGRLIYPMETPRGPNNDGSISRGRRYQPKTVDYLKLMIFDSEKNNPYTYSGKGGTGSSGGKKDTILKTIYLYLPHDLNETYSTSYDKVALGPFGDMVVQAMKTGDMGAITQNLQDGAKAAKPEIAFSAVSGIFNDAARAFMVDGNMSKNQLAALAKGKVFNPYEETVFKGVNYRTHNFTFDMAPRNAKEVENIVKIATTLRDAMLPGVSGAKSRWLTIPRFFKIELVRYNPRRFEKKGNSGNMSKPEVMSTLLTYPVNLVLTNMQLNFTPTGQNSSLRDADFSGIDYGPASYKMTLTFDETAFVTRDMYKEKKK